MSFLSHLSICIESHHCSKWIEKLVICFMAIFTHESVFVNASLNCVSTTNRIHSMERNPLNTNQKIHHGDHFHGSPVINQQGYLIANHLHRIYACLCGSLELNSRICLMRFDLFVPEHASAGLLCSNTLISKFFGSLRAKITHAQHLSRNEGSRVHDADLRYIWCREVSSNGRVHYHVALILNHAAYAFIGRFNLDSRNMYARIHEAWATALSMYVKDVVGYVHIPLNPTYRITRGDVLSFNAAFYRVSYFSKLDTKQYQQGFHTFGCSRI